MTTLPRTSLAILFALATLCAVAGCADEPTEDCAGDRYHPYVRSPSLRDLPRFAPYAKDGSPVEVYLDYGTPVLHGIVAFEDGERYCYEPDREVTVKLDELTATLRTTGGWACFGTAGALCAPPIFAIDIPPGYPTAGKRVTITDRDYVGSFPLE